MIVPIGRMYSLAVWISVDGEKDCEIEYYKSRVNAEDAYKQYSCCVDVIAEKLIDARTGEVILEFNDESEWEDDSEVTDDV